jgi:AcrR family transcriptional regulator
MKNNKKPLPDGGLRPAPATSDAIATRAPGRPTQQAAVELRELFLQTALEVFLADGYSGASIERIARAAKASKVTLYRQFGSKAELFRAAARHAQFKIRTRLDAAAIDLEGDPERALIEIILRLTDAYMDPEYIGIWRLVVAEAQRFPEAGIDMISSASSYLDTLIECLAQLDRKGIIAVDNPHSAAIQLTGMISGGVRFLIIPPPEGAAARRRWGLRVHALFWNSWRHAAGHSFAGDAKR